MLLPYEDVVRFCEGRLCDLGWRVGADGRIEVDFGFEEWTVYFTVERTDLEYVEMPAGLTIEGGIAQLALADAARVRPRWHHLASTYAGTALLLWENDGRLDEARDEELFIIVAGSFSYHAGPHWDAKRGRGARSTGPDRG